MQGNDEIIELLNEVLTAELTAVNQYFLDSRMLSNWGYERLGKRFYEESLDEMKDADQLIERILYFDGMPNLQRLGTIRVGETAPEKLTAALDLEKEAIERLNRGSPSASPRATTAAAPPRGHPRGRGGPCRLARVTARADQPGRRGPLPRPADPRVAPRHSPFRPARWGRCSA